MTGAWFNGGPEYQQAYAEQGLIIDVTEEIHRALKEQGVSKAELGRRLGLSRSTVQRNLLGNMTLVTAARALHALGYRLDVRAVPLGGEDL